MNTKVNSQNIQRILTGVFVALIMIWIILINHNFRKVGISRLIDGLETQPTLNPVDTSINKMITSMNGVKFSHLVLDAPTNTFDIQYSPEDTTLNYLKLPDEEKVKGGKFTNQCVLRNDTLYIQSADRNISTYKRTRNYGGRDFDLTLPHIKSITIAPGTSAVLSSTWENRIPNLRVDVSQGGVLNLSNTIIDTFKLTTSCGSIVEGRKVFIPEMTLITNGGEVTLGANRNCTVDNAVIKRMKDGECKANILINSRYTLNADLDADVHSRVFYTGNPKITKKTRGLNKVVYAGSGL